MASKNIAVRDEVYSKLAKVKRDDESFSDAIDRLLRKTGRLSDFAGALEGTKDLEAMDADIRRIRKLAVIR